MVLILSNGSNIWKAIDFFRNVDDEYFAIDSIHGHNSINT